MAGFSQPTYTTAGGVEQAYLVVASIAAPVGPKNDGGLGKFDTLAGGEPAATVTKHRPGGMGLEVAYGGLITFGDLTIGRVYEAARDWELERSLLPYVGRVAMWVNEQPLDPDGTPYGNAKQYHGVLKAVNPGKVDSGSAANRMWELIVTVTSRS